MKFRRITPNLLSVEGLRGDASPLPRRIAGPRMQACPRPDDTTPRRFRMPLWRSFTAVRALKLFK